MLVKFVVVALVMLVSEALVLVAEITSPTLPAAASLLVVVPMMPDVVLNVMLAVVNAGMVVDQDGTPPALVINIELLAGVITPSTFALDANIMVLIALVAG